MNANKMFKKANGFPRKFIFFLLVWVKPSFLVFFFSKNLIKNFKLKIKLLFSCKLKKKKKKSYLYQKTYKSGTFLGKLKKNITYPAELTGNSIHFRQKYPKKKKSLNQKLKN